MILEYMAEDGSRIQGSLSIEPSVADTSRRSDVAPGFISLHLDIFFAVTSHLDDEGILCLSQTCRVLQRYCSKLWLIRTEILDLTCESHIRIRMQNHMGGRTFFHLSYLLRFYSLENIKFECDLASICAHSFQISNFILACAENLVSVAIKFCREDPMLRWSGISRDFLLVLGALTTSCFSITVDASIFYNLAEDTSERKTIARAQQPIRYYKSRLQHTMTSVVTMDIDLSLFCTASLSSTVLTALLQGPALHHLNLTCPNYQQYEEFISQAKYPLLVSFHVRVRDPQSLKLDSGFLARHPNLESLSLLNSISQRRGSPQVRTPSSPIKLPSSLHDVHISANYSCWEMDDSSLLTSFAIDPVFHSIRPPTEPYCEAVRSVTTLMLSSQHIHFKPHLVFKMGFPEGLARHIYAFKRGGCRCPPLNCEVIRDVFTLELRVDILDDNFQEYLQKWLGWFPQLISIKLVYEKLFQDISREHLAALRRQCHNLSIYSYSDSYGQDSRSSQTTWNFGEVPGFWTSTENS